MVELALTNFEPQIGQNTTPTYPTVLYKLTGLNQTLHGGIYTCTAVIDNWEAENGTISQELNLRVYVKPNYMLHIGMISGVCVILFAILAGLVAYSKRVQTRSKNRYQELLSTVDIQYHPTKVDCPI